MFKCHKLNLKHREREEEEQPRRGRWSSTEGTGHPKVQGAGSMDRLEGISQMKELKKDVQMGMSADSKGARLGLTWFLHH